MSALQPDPQTTFTWERTGSREHRVTIHRSYDGIPPDWNRVYEKGRLVSAGPPFTDGAGNTWVGNTFADCGFHGGFSVSTET